MKNIMFQFFCSKFKKSLKTIFKILKKTQQIPTIAYNMKGCLRLPTFIFFKIAKLTKYTYG